MVSAIMVSAIPNLRSIESPLFRGSLIPPGPHRSVHATERVPRAIAQAARVRPSSARAFASLAQNVTPSADATVSRNLGGEPTGQTQQRVRDGQARERLPGHEDEHVSAG